jgi:V8-like Glu-specific endopeptidase
MPSLIPFTLRHVFYTTAFPARVMGKVFFTRGGVDWQCSGTVVTAHNRSLIFTAGHCVYEDGLWSSHFIFVPAYNNGNAPFGKFVWRNMWAPPAWLDYGEESYDLGAVELYPNAQGKLVQNAVGAEGIEWNYPRPGLFNSFGYPAAPPFNGLSLWECLSSYGGSDSTQVWPYPMAIGCDMTPGSSGGGWIRNGYLDGLNTYSYATAPDVMYSPYFGGAVRSLWNTTQVG